MYLTSIRKTTNWPDSIKVEKTNLLKLLQDRIEKGNLRRELTAAETKRLAKLQAVAKNLSVEKTCKTASYKRGD